MIEPEMTPERQVHEYVAMSSPDPLAEYYRDVDTCGYLELWDFMGDARFYHAALTAYQDGAKHTGVIWEQSAEYFGRAEPYVSKDTETVSVFMHLIAGAWKKGYWTNESNKELLSARSN